MKYNEPIRPKGLSKDQIAFPISANYTEYEQDVFEYNAIAQESNEHDIQGAKSEAITLSKGSAIASASNAHKKSQNHPFGMYGITEFAMNGVGLISTGIPFSFVNIANPNYTYNARDRYIYVTEPGFYYVQVFFYSTAIQGVHDWALSVTTNVGNSNWGEIYEPYFDYRNLTKHPSLNGSTIINLPNQDEIANSNGYYGFRINIHGNMGFVNFTTANTKCAIHVFKLSDLYEANRGIYNKNV